MTPVMWRCTPVISRSRCRRSRRSSSRWFEPGRYRFPWAGTIRLPTRTPRDAPNVIGAGRVSMIHFDAHADTGDIEFGSLWGHGQPMRRLIESGAVRGDRFLQVGLRGYWPPPETLEWMATQRMRSYEMTEIVQRSLRECLTEVFTIAPDDCDGVFLSVDIDVCDPGHAPGTGPRSRVGCRRANCWTRCAGSVSSCRWSGWMWSRSVLRTTTLTSLPRWRIEWCWRPCAPLPAKARSCEKVRDGIRCCHCLVSGRLRSRRARSPNITTLTSATIKRGERQP